MVITGIKTHHITRTDTDINVVLDKYITNLPEDSVLAITSKIVSICEGSTLPISKTNKDELVRKESERYIDKSNNAYNMYLTITHGTLAATAGVDESNGNGDYVLWPKDPYKSAHDIREYLKTKHNVRNLGVIITDSKTTPLRWGTTGTSLGHAGFNPLHDYIGKPDLFNQEMRVTKASIVDGLAAAVVLVMGEGAEATPLALMTDCPNVSFRDTDPEEERTALHITLSEDLYATILEAAPWKRGEKAQEV